MKVDPAKQAAAGKKPKKNAVVITEVQHYAVDYAIAGPQLHFVDLGNMHHTLSWRLWRLPSMTTANSYSESPAVLPAI